MAAAEPALSQLVGGCISVRDGLVVISASLGGRGWVDNQASLLFASAVSMESTNLLSEVKKHVAMQSVPLCSLRTSYETVMCIWIYSCRIDRSQKQQAGKIAQL